MTQIDQIIADALAGLPETDVAILAREVVRLREAPAVVVPEWDEEAFASAHATPPNPSFEYSAAMRAAKAGYKFLASRLRTIPADRGLGDGMVGVDRGDCALAVEWRHAVQDLNPGYLEAKDHEACERFNALRTNQGGADHD